jgi:endonuclease/exonuclease/phosphatase family metal-dependent hydrolase
MDIELSENFILKLIACHLESNQSNSSFRKGKGFINNIKKGYEARNKEVKMICDSLSQYQGPLIIAGDLNDISGSKTLNTLQKELNLNDAWWKSGFGYGATSFSKHLYFRLDHILFSHHFKSTSIEIPKVDFSDHYPIVTNLEIQ